ncbi:MAG: hypothetical protein JXA69_20475, partial [Phycisphaerae bacterium]|nr:hypothetical protein [Phycisphaerae bacterium]
QAGASENWIGHPFLAYVERFEAVDRPKTGRFAVIGVSDAQRSQVIRTGRHPAVARVAGFAAGEFYSMSSRMSGRLTRPAILPYRAKPALSASALCLLASACLTSASPSAL